MAEVLRPTLARGPQAQDERQRKPRRTKTGRVTSNKMNKTVVVAVETVARSRREPNSRRTRRASLYAMMLAARDSKPQPPDP